MKATTLLFTLCSCLALLAVSSCQLSPPDEQQVVIKRTKHGIPHIYAKNYQQLGFGLGYVFAQDNYCMFAESVLAVRSQKALNFGATERNIGEDLYYQIVEVQAKASLAIPHLSADNKALLQGYATGLNHYSQQNTAKLNCEHAAATGTITVQDLLAYQLSLAMDASSWQLAKELVTAEAPVQTGHSGRQQPQFDHDYRELALGSNAWVIGQEQGRYQDSFLMANPHFSWVDSKRLYMAHLVIPGQLDVMGAALFGIPAIQIGFNKDISWTHTISKASRFVIYALELDPANPYRYKVGQHYKDMRKKTVTVPFKKPDGSIGSLEKVYYSTEFGPVVSAPDKGMAWTSSMAFAIADANANNLSMSEQWLQLNRAGSLAQFNQSLATVQGLPWINTLAVSTSGQVYYADTSRVPRLPNALQQRCYAFDGAANIFRQTGIAVLMGTNPDCNLTSNGEVKVFALSEAPVLQREDHLANANNSHWAPHLTTRLEGFPALFGPEKSPLSLRARANLLLLQEQLQKRAQLNLPQLEEAILDNRHYGADLLLEDILARCPQLTEFAAACKVLAAWDRKVDLNSKGAHVFRELMMFLKEQGETSYFKQPFDPAVPLQTPSGLTEDTTMLATAFQQTMNLMRENQLPLDAALGDIQFTYRAGQKIPVHGGLGQIGAFNVIDGPLHPKEGYEVRHGNSFILLTRLTKAGPEARGILTYSQATDPASAYYQDQTLLYKDKKLIILPFTENDIGQQTVELLRLHYPQ